MGRLIEAPVCEVRLVDLGADMVGEEFSPGRFLEEGLASGSRDVRNVNPLRSFEHRQDDDNRRRHAGVFALYDWCWGEDDQWLYDWSDSYRLFSHDHGHFLPGGGPDWTIADLERTVDEAHRLGQDPDGLDATALDQYADRLEALTPHAFHGMLRTVPTSWPVQQEELEALGWYLQRRAPQVSQRLRDIASELKGGAGR